MADFVILCFFCADSRNEPFTASSNCFIHSSTPFSLHVLILFNVKTEKSSFTPAARDFIALRFTLVFVYDLSLFSEFSECYLIARKKAMRKRVISMWDKPAQISSTIIPRSQKLELGNKSGIKRSKFVVFVLLSNNSPSRLPFLIASQGEPFLRIETETNRLRLENSDWKIVYSKNQQRTLPLLIGFVSRILMISFRGLGNRSPAGSQAPCVRNLVAFRNRITDSNGTFHVNVMRRSERIQPLARKPIEIYFNGFFGEGMQTEKGKGWQQHWLMIT